MKSTSPIAVKTGLESTGWRVLAMILIAPVTAVALLYSLIFLFGVVSGLIHGDVKTVLSGTTLRSGAPFIFVAASLIPAWVSILFGISRLAARRWIFVFSIVGLLIGLGFKSIYLYDLVFYPAKGTSPSPWAYFAVIPFGVCPVVAEIVTLIGLIHLKFSRLKVESIPNELPDPAS